MADLTIKVEGNIKNDVENLSKALETGREKGAVKPERYRDASTELNKIKQLLGKDTFSEQDVKSFKHSFKEVAKVLDTASKNLVQQTKEMLELEKKMKEARERVNKLESSRRATRDSRTSAINGYKELLSSNKVSVGKRGTGTTNLETLVKNKDNFDSSGKLKRGVEIYQGDKALEGDARRKLVTKINELAAQYNSQIQKEKEINGELVTAKQEVVNAEKAYKEQVDKDTAAGKTKNIDFANQVNAATGSVHNTIGGWENQLSTTKEQNAILESNVSLSGLDANAGKSANSLGRVVKQFSLYRIGLGLAKKAINEVKRTIVDLDKSLTEQAMVTGKTRKEVYGLLSSYQDLAIKTGSTTKEVSATVTEFIRQGKSTTEAMTLAEAAIDAAKVASINTADSINYLTTALNGFQLSAQQAMEVSDKFAAVSANAATSYEEIAIALSKVASQANLAGMSIDYTTALLAKGLETTREAPETIGTALKTVIARMREITDYGETLEDGVDLNNVESQLAYVGIQLKNASGELRSTEDVLDDLGKKWDTLNSNQQAAIAKALAGTRQQSRLIAMMSDYERVTELQEISARSAGATMAQMETYTQGLEAALNRLSTSWEKIVSTVSNSDVIIGLVNIATNILDAINDILNSTFGMVAVITILATLGLKVLANKVQERKMNQLIIKDQKRQRVESLKNVKIQKQARLEQNKGLIVEKQKYLTMLKENLEKAKQSGNLAEQQRLNTEISATQKEITELETEQVSLTKEIGTLDTEIAKTQGQSQSFISQMGTGILGILAPLGMIFTLWKLIAKGITTAILLTKKQTTEEAKQAGVSKINAAWKMAGSAGHIPWTGWAIGLAILAAVGISLGIAFANMAQGSKSSDEQVEELSASIYTLTKRASAIESVTSQIDKLDSKLIKTKKDAEEVASALATIGDKLSSNAEDNLDKSLGDMSEQDYYNALGDAEKREYLTYYQSLLEQQLEADRQSMMDIINSTGIDSETKRLNAKTVAKSRGYDVLDERFSNLTTTQTSTLRSIMDTIIDSSTDDQLLRFANHSDLLAESLARLANIKTSDNSLAVEVLQDEDASLKDRTLAFKELKETLGDLSAEFMAINTAYQEFNVFAAWDESVLDLIDDLKISNDELNDLWQSYESVAKTLKNQAGEDGTWTSNFTDIITEEQYQEAMLNTLSNIAAYNGNITAAINDAFGEYLVNFSETDEMYAAIVNQIANTIQIGVQNIGQNVDKLKNTVTSMYDVVGKWNSMSYTDQSTFIAEHGEMFDGEQGTALLKALKTQDYEQIKLALAENKTLANNIKNELQELNNELNAEIAKGANANQATIQFLQERIRELESTDFLSVDLETLVEQENKRIEAYKELLQKEQDALTKSLEERKNAYQKYFDAINQSAEDEDYEEQATLLVSNLSKLSGSTNATAKAQTEELQNSLAELEKERLEVLRQRAQEAVIQSIDDTIEDISEKFDELLENNREILNMLKGTDSNELVASLLTTDSFSAKTANEAQLYLNELQSTFGAQVSNIDWSNINVSDTGGNLTLNIGDEVIQLTGQETQGRNIKDAIIAALTQNGINVSA